MSAITAATGVVVAVVVAAGIVAPSALAAVLSPSSLPSPFAFFAGAADTSGESCAPFAPAAAAAACAAAFGDGSADILEGSVPVASLGVGLLAAVAKDEEAEDEEAEDEDAGVALVPFDDGACVFEALLESADALGFAVLVVAPLVSEF